MPGSYTIIRLTGRQSKLRFNGVDDQHPFPVNQMIYSTDDLTPAEQIRFWPLTAYLGKVKETALYVSYQQAERDCQRLGAVLREHYSARELATFTFAGIPRGGLIVLGLLAYYLDLDRAQIQPMTAEISGPLCLVDDCALTGYRFGQMVRDSQSRRIVFAHLYSSPHLRRAILEQESRVEQCLAARDLGEGLPLAGDPGHEADVTMEQHLGPDRYWTGPVQPVAFAWSEPDLQVLAAQTRQVEGRWRLVAPDQCLKNRVRLGLPLRREVAERAWQVPEAVVTGWFDGVLWLLQTETQEVYRLDGPAREIWRGLAVYGDLDATLDYLAQENVRLPANQVTAIMERLRSLCLIEPR